jgi:hypothetical protein
VQHPHGRPQRRAPHGRASRILIPRHHGASRTALNRHGRAACPSATRPPAPQDCNQPHIIRSHEKGKPFSRTWCQQLLGYLRPAARTAPARKLARTTTATTRMTAATAGTGHLAVGPGSGRPREGSTRPGSRPGPAASPSPQRGMRVVRREALRYIPGVAGMDWRDVLGSDVLPGVERLREKEHGAPRGALPYSLCSREELGGRFLGPMPYLAPKG